MAAFTVGALAVAVQADTFRREADEPIGGEPRRAIDGTLRSTADTGKRTWALTTGHLTSAESDTLLAAIPAGVAVLCAGDLMPAGGISCLVTRTGTRHPRHSATFRVVHELELREV